MVGAVGAAAAAAAVAAAATAAMAAGTADAEKPAGRFVGCCALRNTCRPCIRICE